MKILLLGFNRKKKSYAVSRLVTELKKRGHTVNYSFWEALVFSFTKNGVSIKRAKGTDLKYYDYIITRNPHFRKKYRMSQLYRHYLLMVDYINQHHKHVLNEKTTKKIAFYDKLFQHYLLARNGLPIVASRLYTGQQTPDLVYKKFPRPYIVKSIEGSGGKQVFLISNPEKDLKSIVEEFGPANMLVQKYIPSRSDYRVLVVGKKVVGAIKRTAAEDDFRANVSSGGTTENVKPSQELKSLALKAAKIFNAEFAGVDIMKHQGKYYVLEVNIFPGFEGFEKATEINVAKELVTYIEKKYLWSIDTPPSQKSKLELFDDLYRIEKENLEESLNKKQFKEELKEKELTIINKENKPIAYMTHYKKGSTRHISRLVILPRYMGQRIGRRMLRYLINTGREEKDSRIRAVVSEKNERRQKSFQRAGFKKVQTKKNYFAGNVNGLVFEYKISPEKRTKSAGLTKADQKDKKQSSSKPSTKKRPQSQEKKTATKR